MLFWVALGSGFSFTKALSARDLPKPRPLKVRPQPNWKIGGQAMGAGGLTSASVEVLPLGPPVEDIPCSFKRVTNPKGVLRPELGWSFLGGTEVTTGASF